MAMPCIPGLRPHNVWMVFSAPEITTVSNPNRKPASAEVMDQNRMRGLMEERRPRVVCGSCEFRQLLEAFHGCTRTGHQAFASLSRTSAWHGPSLSLIHISEPTRQAEISYAVFCLKKK